MKEFFIDYFSNDNGLFKKKGEKVCEVGEDLLNLLNDRDMKEKKCQDAYEAFQQVVKYCFLTEDCPEDIKVRLKDFPLKKRYIFFKNVICGAKGSDFESEYGKVKMVENKFKCGEIEYIKTPDIDNLLEVDNYLMSLKNNVITAMSTFRIDGDHNIGAAYSDLMVILNRPKEDLIIKKCELCKKYFIPSRSNEKYCNGLYKDNKTCKQYGYEKLVIENEPMQRYRREYKRRFAEISSLNNENTKVKRKGKLSKWAKETRGKALALIKSNCSEKEFEKQLKESE